jgi:hypothetical protein
MMVESPGSSGAFALGAGMIGNVQMEVLLSSRRRMSDVQGRRREAGSERRGGQNRALMDDNRINAAARARAGNGSPSAAITGIRRCGGGKSGRRREGTIFLRQIFAVSGRSD